MSLFVCSKCQVMDSVSLAGFFNQVYIEKKKPLCCKCKTGKHHNHFERRIATVNHIMDGDVVNFEHYRDVDIVKKLMIDYITNGGKSVLPRNHFEKMDIKEVLVIYRKLKGK